MTEAELQAFHRDAQRDDWQCETCPNRSHWSCPVNCLDVVRHGAERVDTVTGENRKG